MDPIKAARLTRQVDMLGLKVEQLEASEKEFLDSFEGLWNQLAELNLRVLYTMQMMKMQRKGVTGLLADATGQVPQEIIQTNLYELYCLERESFQRKVAASVAAAQAGDDAHTSVSEPDVPLSTSDVLSGAKDILSGALVP